MFTKPKIFTPKEPELQVAGKEPVFEINATGGMKHVGDKLPYDLLNPGMVLPIVLALSYGLSKGYKPNSWQETDEVDYEASHDRHWLKGYKTGAITDPESGLDHLCGAMFALAALFCQRYGIKVATKRPQKKTPWDKLRGLKEIREYALNCKAPKEVMNLLDRLEQEIRDTPTNT